MIASYITEVSVRWRVRDAGNGNALLLEGSGCSYRQEGNSVPPGAVVRVSASVQEIIGIQPSLPERQDATESYAEQSQGILQIPKQGVLLVQVSCVCRVFWD